MTPDELRASFQPAQLRHLPSILYMRSQGNPLPWDDQRYLQWRYDFVGKPDSRGRLMISAQGDTVLGMVGIEKVRLFHDKKILDAVLVMDIMVDPSLYSTGLGAWLNMAIFDQYPVVFEIGANPNSIGLISRLFHLLPNCKYYVAPIRFDQYLAKRLRIPFLASLLAVPANFGFQLWRTMVSHQIPSSWSLRDLTQFDDTVDRLFTRRWNGDSITVERSSSYLNWRLFASPRARYSVLAAFEGSEMVGYIAYQRYNQSDGLKSFRLVDWLLDGRYGFFVFNVLVQEIARCAHAEKIDRINLSPLHNTLEQSLWRLGFLSRPGNKYATVGVRCSEPIPWPSLYDGLAWYITEANSDIDGIASRAVR